MNLNNCLALAFGAALCAGLVGCDEVKTTQLVSVWTNNPTQTEWGLCTMEINFQPNGDLGFTLRPAEGEGSISRNGRYSLHRGNLVSDVLNHGQPIPFEIQEDTLVIKVPGETPARFKRK